MSQRAGSGGIDSRLQQFRSDFPKRVPWSEVREEDPKVFRKAAFGALLLPIAFFVTGVWTSVASGVPVAIPMPPWLGFARDFVAFALFVVGFGVWILSWVLLSGPRDTRRSIAVRRFGERQGLRFARVGIPPTRLGILFSEDPATRIENSPAAEFGNEALNHHVRFALSSTEYENFMKPALQIAVAVHVDGGKGSSGFPTAFRFLALRMPRQLPHLMIDSLHNGRLRSVLPGSQRLSLEGDFDRHFAVYVPDGYERDALELLTPDVLVCLLELGRWWDIEVVEDRVFVVSSRVRRRFDRREIPALLHFAEILGAELGHQASTYTDPRADKPRTQVGQSGRRLRRRQPSKWGGVVFLAAGFVGIFAFAFILKWAL